MSWTALIPLKGEADRKSRLATAMAPWERVALSERMFDHVVTVLGDCPVIERIVLLAPVLPLGWRHGWIADEGRGLNTELAACRPNPAPGNMLVVHADLPCLAAADIGALLESASVAGVAIAPDRHGTGTNALAVRAGSRLPFRFGTGSFLAHCNAAPTCAVVRRDGFALDVDTPEDLALARAAEPGIWMEQ